MSIGLLALLDDVAGLAKVAAASLDDVAGQVAKAGIKAAGVVIDDAAMTPGYVVGFAAARELPIVGKIALGSLRNKLLLLLPAALALEAFAPWAIIPLLVIGGAYLCYEGTEKVYEAFVPQAAHPPEAGQDRASETPETLEARKVSSAVKTDFILSAEIMAITLGALPEGTLWEQAVVLALVGIGITAAVYGGVALIVKADDAGVALAGWRRAAAWAAPVRAFGRSLVLGMPIFLAVLSVVGTAAMLWVGGGIVLHGLDLYGPAAIGDAIDRLADIAAAAVPAMAEATHWAVSATASGLAGLLVGAILILATTFVLAPGWKRIRALRG
ncbi:MAG TPA: DUF808 domain-containing protein [Lichenihabitans sp.]|nr:DUF808 domain-containing protein [Lichenihabitans sp.]